MTIAQALKLAAARLKAGRINNPPLEAEILLSDILKKPREFSLAHGEKPLAKSQIAKYRQLIKRRLKGEPVAYLTGHKEFYGLNFLVNKNVLIPRPETELMIEETLKLVARDSQPTTVVDVGTGSGCIIITLAKLLNKESRITNYNLMATDISPKTLTVAKQNAKLHGVGKNIKFKSGDLIEPLIKSKIKNQKSKIFLANLPYGWKAWKNNCSLNTVGLKFEPAIALFTGHRGLELYKKLFQQIKKLRIASNQPRKISALCEFDPRQTKMMKELIKHELPEAKCQIKKDLAGLNRLAIINIPSP